jgi:hypothetical protein
MAPVNTTLVLECICIKQKSKHFDFGCEFSSLLVKDFGSPVAALSALLT